MNGSPSPDMPAVPERRAVAPSGLVRWVHRVPPAVPAGKVIAPEGTVFDKAGATDRDASQAPGAREWVLEMLCHELDPYTGQAVAQAWIPVPRMTAEQAAKEDRANGINAAGLLVVGR